MSQSRFLAATFFFLVGWFASSGVAHASIPLGTGNGSLLGGDLTDPEDAVKEKEGVNYGQDKPEADLMPLGGNWLRMKCAPASPPGTAPHQRHPYQSWQGAPACAIFLNNPEKRKWYVGFRDGGKGGPTKDAPYYCAVEFKDAFVLTHFTITTAPDMPGRDPLVWAIQGSNTGREDDWADIYRCDAKGRDGSPFREKPRSETTLLTAFTSADMAKVVTPADLKKLQARIKGKEIGKADFALPKKAYPWFRVAIYSCFNPNGNDIADVRFPPGFALGQLELFGVKGVREKPVKPKARPFDPPFILAAWSGPAATAARYKEYAECGFNLVLGTDLKRPAGDAELAKAAGLKAIVADRRLFAFKPGHPEFEKNVQAVAARYKDDPAVAGLYLMDEPGTERFEELKQFNDQIEKIAPRLVPFVNLMPTYSPPQALGTGSYEDYVRRYIRAVNPPFVCWSHFPLLDNGTARPDYFENLEIVSRICHERNLPFVPVVCSVPHGMHRAPDEADLRWQAYTSLAYGARGIIHFTYTTPANDGWEYHDAILDAKGERTVKYAYARRLNRKLAALGPLLAKLEGVRVAHADPVPRGGAGFDRNFPVASARGGTMLVGWLQDAEGKDYLFVVNRHFAPSRPWISGWKASGPYQADGKTAGQLLDLPFALESGKDAAWKAVAAPGDAASKGMIDLAALAGEKRDSVVYLQARVKSALKQEALLSLGSSGGIRAWLNGKLVHSGNVPRPHAPDQDRVKVSLVEGWNTVLLKAAHGAGASRVSARFIKPPAFPKPKNKPEKLSPVEGLEHEEEKPEDSGTREFTLVLQGKASHVAEISQETGEPAQASFDLEKRTLTVKLLAGEGKLFKLSEKGITFSPPAEIHGGKELRFSNIAFVPEKPGARAAGKLYWRRKGETKFAGLPLEPAARERFKVTLPAAVTKGLFEYYIEMQEEGQKPVREPAQGEKAPLLATPDLTPPTAVPELATTTARSYRVALAWKPATDDRGVAGYRIHRGMADKFALDEKTLLAKLPAESLAFSDDTPPFKQAAWYAVRAIDVVGREGEARYLRVDVPGHQPPANTLKVQAVPGSKSVLVKWSGELEPNVAALEIHRGEGKDGPMKKIGEAGLKAAQFLDKEAVFGTAYRYAVRPRSSAGLVGEAGAVATGSPLRYLKRINCGGPEIAAEDGVPWEADAGDGHAALKYSGSNPWTMGAEAKTDIYKSERWGRRGVGYSFKVDPGRYEVVLHFAETNAGYAGKGKRLFDILINDKTLAEKVDVFTEAGGASRPWLFRRTVEVEGRELEVKMLANPTSASIKGIEIRGLPPK